MACLRITLNWSVVSAVDEFERYAGSDGSWFDVQYIENFGMSMTGASLS